jgi:hypothetical protein
MEFRSVNTVAIISLAMIGSIGGLAFASAAENPEPPLSPVKLIFIHHSCGENWLADLDGGLGIALRDNNYFVSDTNYGWGPGSIGDNTDIGNWWTWFCGLDRDIYLSALFFESGQHSDYSRMPRDPGGESEIIMLKSCYPNSCLKGNPRNPSPSGNNPLRGEWCGSAHHTVSNAKGIYNDLLEYFATRQDKLFVVITAPPQVRNEADIGCADNARAFNNWLTNDWLASYPHSNVAVFDLYNVLTSNGGDVNRNDMGKETGNHHRWWNGSIQHIQTKDNNFSAYGSSLWDSHPTPAGNQKATAEFVPLLNVFYHRWKADISASAIPDSKPLAEEEITAHTLPVLKNEFAENESDTQTLKPSEALPGQTPPATLDLPLTVTNHLNTSRKGEPVTSGVPIPQDLNLIDLSSLRLLDSSGQPVPAQFLPLARWGGAPDDISKPIKWLLLDFQVDVPANGNSLYRLVSGGGIEPKLPPLEVIEDDNSIIIDTGVAQFIISKIDGTLSAPHLASPLIGRATSSDGIIYDTQGPVTVTETVTGPMRVSFEVRGVYRNEAGLPLLNYTNRYWFYAGQPVVRLFHTVENNNPCPLGEYEQLDCYSIGSEGSIDLKDLSLVLPCELEGNITYEMAGEDTPVTGNLTADLLLYQDSSGTDYWNHYLNLTDWDGNELDARPRMQAYVTFRGYRTLLDTTVIDNGDHFPGWLSLYDQEGAISIAVQNFWQNFPKALRASEEGTLEIGLFPEEFGPSGYSFNLRAGEHKTHEIAFVLSQEIGWNERMTDTLFARAPPEWYVQSGAITFLSFSDYEDWQDFELYLDHQLTTSPKYEDWMNWYPNLPTAIESTDFYGIFDFGDWPIDYEGYGVAPLNSKYNNHYGAWLQWMRSGNSIWFDLAEAGGRHVADVDILHNLHSPRHWGDGIAFGHSYHDEDGYANPHRNYGGTHPDTAYGMPGMLLTYYLTGYEKAYESALELGDCIEFRLSNDEHLCDFFPPGECNGCGYALGEGLYDGGARPAANSLSIAASAYRATGDPRYLNVSNALVNWAQAKGQPYINGPTGEDQKMRPWMLNMYLRSLADYMEMREEFGLPDTYNAGDSYLAYSNWLCTYPWIDLDPIDSASRGAYPYEWWFDNRTDISGEDNDNQDASINNWLLVGADALAYAYHLSGDEDYMKRAVSLFWTGTRDPWFEGDVNTYSSSKETANAVVWGQVFLQEWQQMNETENMSKIY